MEADGEARRRNIDAHEAAVVAREVGKRLSSNAKVNCDSGTTATWFARQIPVKRGQLHTLSGNLATMSCGATGLRIRVKRAGWGGLQGGLFSS
ncbi:MAG: hypothetical protein ACR2NN_04640 [Bryobacteraceae bacterium]